MNFRKATLLSLMLVSYISLAQVGIGTTTPSSSAMLEVSSTSDGGTTYKGFMPPRVPTISDRDNINPSAADIGLLVFVQSTNCLQIWTGSAWEDVKCITGGGGGGSILGIQDFEIVPTTPTYMFTDSGVGQLQAGTGSFPASNKYKSPDRGYGVQNGTSTMNFVSVDASSFSSCNLSFYLASFSGTSGNGADTNDIITVSISVDGGTSFSDELTVRGQGNAKWDFDGTGTAIINYDGDNTPTDFQSPNGSGGIATVQVNGITNASDIVLRLTMLNNAGNELWVIDDVQMEGM